MTAQQPWVVAEGLGPFCALAIHDGHDLRREVANLIALPEENRLREEDPYTGEWTNIAATNIVVRRSRFEVDLNRPRDRAVYVQPSDAWGLRVWKAPPPPELIERSLEIYDGFYATLRGVLDRLARQHRRFVVFDLHTYNHRRAGPRAFDAQSRHPDINVGTGSLDRTVWAPVVDRLLSALGSCDNLGRRLDVRENVKFFGGHLSRWVHENYPEQACCLAIEVKKFFMNEWNGSLHDDLHEALGELFRQAGATVIEELGALMHGDSQPPRPDGIWDCAECGAQWLSRELKEAEIGPHQSCLKCGKELTFVESVIAIER